MKIPDYIKKALRLADKTKIAPGVYQLNVAHDKDCPKLAGGECRCQPDIWFTKFINPNRN
jgi:hypothetical protein